MSTPSASAASKPVPIRTTLIDITNCIGCRACQVACKQWNDREGEDTTLLAQMGYTNPATLSAKTYTLISFHEMENPESPGGLDAAYVMRRCFHCLEPGCVSACPTTALYRQPDGPVSYDASKCIGCRYCMLACPWDVPTAEWDKLAPKIEKCTHCADRTSQPVPIAFNGQPAPPDETKRFLDTIATPACVKACPADALRYGTRDEMLALAHKRIEDRPDKYIDHVYGEKEVGGTTVVYLSSVPFKKLGFPTYGEKPFPKFTSAALGAVPPAVMAIGAALGAFYAFFKKRAHAVAGADAHHVEFEPLRQKLLTPFNWLLLALMAFCGVSMVARFALGLGGSTNLSDTYPWGLWIAFDLVWIAVAAGAFAMAGAIYVFQRKDLYGLGRSAVLMGLLSYSFVTVTLVADLGLPWHFYELGLNAPEHSAMFEVSWCVGLYVTILALEFLPVVLGRFGLRRLLALWEKWSGAYVAFAVSLFVYLMSRNLVYVAATAVIFGTLAWVFRDRGGKTFRADHARHRRGHPVHDAPELPRIAVPADAEHARLAVVVAGDAHLVLPVLDRGRKRPHHPDRHVDREGVAPAAQHEATRLGRADHVLGPRRLSRVPRRGPASSPDRGSSHGKARLGLSPSSSCSGRRPARAAGPSRRARNRRASLRGLAARHPRRRAQPRLRRPARDDFQGRMP